MNNDVATRLKFAKVPVRNLLLFAHDPRKDVHETLFNLWKWYF